MDSFSAEGRLVSVPRLLGIDPREVKSECFPNVKVYEASDPTTLNAVGAAFGREEFFDEWRRGEDLGCQPPIAPLESVPSSPLVVKSVTYKEVRDPFGLLNHKSNKTQDFESCYAWVACGNDQYVIHNYAQMRRECLACQLD